MHDTKINDFDDVTSYIWKIIIKDDVTLLLEPFVIKHFRIEMSNGFLHES